MSRDLTKLSTFMQERIRRVLARCHEEGLDIVAICTDRSDEEQNACFNAGASNAKAGQSAHNAKDKQGNPASEAVDFGVIRNGKYVGDGRDKSYLRMGEIAEEEGLVWAGRWRGKIKEVAHVQNPNWKKPNC